MVRSEKPKRSTTAPASAARRAQVADRDAKFIEYLKRSDVQEKMNTLKPSKRMGFLIKSFKEETDITVPTTMAYRAWHKACGAIKTNKNGAVKFPSAASLSPSVLAPMALEASSSTDSASEGKPVLGDEALRLSPDVPITVVQWEEDERITPAEHAISEETADII